MTDLLQDPFAPTTGGAPGQDAAVHPTRLRTFQQPDPTWASLGLCETIRQRLWKMDPKLNLWWNPHWPHTDRPADRGRWAIMYWLDDQRCWSVVFYHEGPTGEYRPLDVDCIDHLIRRLEVCHQDARETLAEIQARRAETVRLKNLRFDESMMAFGREVNMYIGATGQKGSARRSRAKQRIAEAKARHVADVRADEERRRQERYAASRGAQEFRPS